ncbi:diacylglycerol kinase family protein [Ureibacillus sinduriensis]|uniref:UDP kinase n=1 Tax=Ureibacillus sinduriensis BLB-1 = JCM 15800 TaxID=1384057 RepID=A0A0A3HTI4_9BACL|nr:diacylglycerol kinase family protein [Ureibacillus sinduriensis]KGR74535.1 UDP kinase [Ureibacillus sinduriensis BLB-1 = JCM 15800]
MDAHKLLKSFGYAFYGIWTAFNEQNMRIHMISALIVIIAGVFTGLTNIEWMIIILVITLVIGAEMINTAIESVVNLASPDIHPLAKQAKDVAAGAVLVFALASVIIGLLIFLPKWF